MIRLFGIVLLLVSLVACDKESDATIQTITFGTYYGECIGTCYNSFSFKEGVFAWEQRDYIGGEIQDICQGGQANSIWMTLTTEFNLATFMALDEVIGCPDCADGGASFIEVEMGNERTRVTFEAGNPPAGMETFHEKVSEFSEEISNLSECQ